MNAFTLIFLAVVALGAGLRLWLARRQKRWVARHRDRVPAAFADRIPLASHQKAADYTVTKTRFEMTSILYHTALLLGWTVLGGLNLLDGAWRDRGLSALVTGIGVIASVALINALLGLPLSLYRVFVIERRYGFNRMTPALFAADLLKGGLLAAAIGLPVVTAVLWLMTPGGTAAGAPARDLWWLYAWLLWIAFSMAMLWAYPAFIAPLFNRFTPLEDKALAHRITELLRRTGFASKGLFVMDGSRRSAHGNAYFAGLGRHKRIVFFDTLLGTLLPEEIEAVLAHELGHYRHRHVHKHLLANMALSLAGLLLIDALLDRNWFYSGLGLTHASNYGALLLFTFAAPAFGLFLDPLFLHFTRRHEYQADDYAAREANPHSLISALVKLYDENAATLDPDPWYSAFHDSHPPATARVGHLLALAESATTVPRT